MTKLLVAVFALCLGACEVGGGHRPVEPPSALAQLLEIGKPPPEPKWTRDDILYSNDIYWPTMPLVEGAWCLMDTSYWTHGVETNFNKQALVIDQVDSEWNLWIYRYSWDQKNNPIPDLMPDSLGDDYGITHCKLKEKLHVVPDPPEPLPPWHSIKISMYREHYDGECQNETKQARDHWETDYHHAMVRLQGFGGQVTVSIALPYELLPVSLFELARANGEVETHYRATATGAWDAMGRCPWLGAPRPEYMDDEKRKRVKKWVWAPIGADAPGDETAAQATARVRKYILSPEYRKDGP